MLTDANCKALRQKAQGFAPRFNPRGPKIEKIQDLEIFKRDWKFQAGHPPNPYFVGNSQQIKDHPHPQ